MWDGQRGLSLIYPEAVWPWDLRGAVGPEMQHESSVGKRETELRGMDAELAASLRLKFHQVAPGAEIGPDRARCQVPPKEDVFLAAL